VRFVDAVLEAAVRKSLNIAADQLITPANMLGLTDVNLYEDGVSSLVGLETATNLRSLDLTGNAITDLSPLTGLRKLATLNLTRTQVSDLAPIRNVPVRNLTLTNTPIADLTEVVNFKSLSRLAIGGTQIIDLAPLRNSSLGVGDALEIGNSSESCLFTAGYSRPLNDITYLRSLNVRVSFVDEKMRRSGCPNPLAQATITLTAELTGPAALAVGWSLTSTDTGAWQCEFHPDLTFQQPGEPLVRIPDCLRESSLAMDVSSGQMPKMLVIHDGLGGRLTRTLMPTRSNNAGPVASISIAGFDFGQSVIKTNPRLVANRDALVRVHVIADQVQTAPAGTLTLQLGEQSQEINLTKPTSLPTLLQLTNLTRSYSAVIPATWVQPGLNLQVKLANGLSKTLVPVVGKGNVLYITLVPITAAGATPQLPTNTAVERNLKTIWPLAQVQVRTHEAVDMAFDAPDEGLAQLADIKASEADTSYVFGVISPSAPNFGVGGLAYIGGKVGMGLDATHDPSGLTMAHEIGHMFGLFHVNCGSPSGIQQDYPYPTTDIGSLGINYTLTSLILPVRASDVMSYCQPQHVSDFTYQRAQAYLEANPPAPFSNTSLARAAAAPRAQSFVVRGHLNAEGSWAIRQALPSPLPVEPTAEGEYRAELLDAQGNSQTTPVRFWQIDHNEQITNRYFSISVPLIEARTLRIWRGDRVVYERDITAI
jgi:Leucine-rich repeat (LRR) protein